jgi:hypothetical protein
MPCTDCPLSPCRINTAAEADLVSLNKFIEVSPMYARQLLVTMDFISEDALKAETSRCFSKVFSRWGLSQPASHGAGLSITRTVSPMNSCITYYVCSKRPVVGAYDIQMAYDGVLSHHSLSEAWHATAR